MVLVNVKNKLFKGILCILIPFIVVIQEILTSGLGSFVSILTMYGSIIQIPLFLIIISLLAFFYVKDIGALKETYKPTHFSKNISILLIPVVTIGGLYYLSNYARFGSIIWTSSIGIPNYDWATNILQSVSQQSPLNLNLSTFVQYFALAYLHPAVMGFIWLVPFAIGLLYCIKKDANEIRIILYFTIIFLVSVFLGALTGFLTSGTFVLNPRDLYPLALPLSILMAVGLYEANVRLFSNREHRLDIIIYSTSYILALRV